ncbi:ABC transporter branched-chain amino acid-binding protein LivK [Gottschalkia acidurici 9a]|uniref:ABC transporter branched-chain amino acid-binding protein LivK n=1 Tax=Gottschalkia acidurici (strain ATCC 7906 / DSM 604 / BCRC 14475 / CIP 104303 / KCTC 5404 / NCIMB 10678 / 9a) TaxID=1128398 RepID=K0B056_GOTA9|nr:ABC transporter substrate-binding protein [Gottschalkia acidurici]AFS79413.1 ABC transporter branched-chain amino acid-binding protein LivK [Gottschalkia acidurici 9a]
MKIKNIAIGLLTLILGTSLVGCSTKESTEIIIGSANPMTGDSAQFGANKVNAIELALDEVNQKGGINGKKVKLIVGDDTGNPKEAPNVAQKFVSNNNMLAVIGHWNSSATLAARGIYESVGMPVITDSVNEAITDGTSPHLFRISLTDTAQAKHLASYAYNELGKRKVAIIYTANDFGTGLKNSFTKEFTKLGGKVVVAETYFEGQSKDFSPQLTKIKNKKPDLLFAPGYYVEVALIAQQAKSVGLDVEILGTEGISSDELVKLGGKAVEGIKFTGFFHPDVEFSGTKEFVEAFKAKYGKEPDTYSALAYDSAKILLKAIEENGENRQGIKKYLEEVKDFPGVAGPITFKDNDVTRGIIILTVKDGKIVPAEVQPK